METIISQRSINDSSGYLVDGCKKFLILILVYVITSCPRSNDLKNSFFILAHDANFTPAHSYECNILELLNIKCHLMRGEERERIIVCVSKCNNATQIRFCWSWTTKIKFTFCYFAWPPLSFSCWPNLYFNISFLYFMDIVIYVYVNYLSI